MLKLAAAFALNQVLDDEPADLRARLQQQFRVAMRRVNRFTELALLGALSLSRERAIAPDSALYLVSEAPMLADCVKAVRGLVDHNRPPTPFEFMNISGNMAGFYIAQRLRLEGPQLAVHRKGGGLQAALDLLQISSAAHRRALVGYVEEGVWPLGEQRQRLGLAPDAPLAECSHWLYFDADCEQTLGVVKRVATSQGSSFAEAAAVLCRLALENRDGDLPGGGWAFRAHRGA